MSKPCKCSASEEEHEHCEQCGCVLGAQGDRENICRWCHETNEGKLPGDERLRGVVAAAVQPVDATMQKLNDRTEVLSILGSLLNGGPGAVALATDSLVTLLDLARRQERITCLEKQMAELEARREVTTETA